MRVWHFDDPSDLDHFTVVGESEGIPPRGGRLIGVHDPGMAGAVERVLIEFEMDEAAQRHEAQGQR